jgi:hypothetical protein
VTADSATARAARWTRRHLWLSWWLVGAAGAFVPVSSVIAWGVWLAWMACFVVALAATARRSLPRAALVVIAFGVAGLIPLFLFPAWMVNARAHPAAHLGVLAVAAAGAFLLSRRMAPSPVDERPPGPRRITRRTLGTAALALLLLFVYAGGKMGWAQHQTRELCRQIAVGGPITGLEDAAARRGLVVWSAGATPASGPRPATPAFIMAFEGFAFGREYCMVQHADGRVTRAHTASLD